LNEQKELLSISLQKTILFIFFLLIIIMYNVAIWGKKEKTVERTGEEYYIDVT
jgi:hypothetical protein